MNDDYYKFLLFRMTVFWLQTFRFSLQGAAPSDKVCTLYSTCKQRFQTITVKFMLRHKASLASEQFLWNRLPFEVLRFGCHISGL